MWHSNKPPVEGISKVLPSWFVCCLIDLNQECNFPCIVLVILHYTCCRCLNLPFGKEWENNNTDLSSTKSAMSMKDLKLKDLILHILSFWFLRKLQRAVTNCWSGGKAWTLIWLLRRLVTQYNWINVMTCLVWPRLKMRKTLGPPVGWRPGKGERFRLRSDCDNGGQAGVRGLHNF